MKLWRITRSAFEALDGEGARSYGGRWNSEGVAVVYLSTSLALAAMEYLVHVDIATAPTNLISVEVDVPDEVSREYVNVDSLPEDWNASSDHPSCVDLGDDWIRRGESCLLLVPSAVIPRSWNALLNPGHQEARQITYVAEPFIFDRRLLQ